MLTHSNHDLRFVFGPEADYCVKYSAKQQGPVNNDGLVNCHQQAVTRSFDRRLRIQSITQKNSKAIQISSYT